jgi:hypothetical protein
MKLKKTLNTYCEQAGRRGKDYERKKERKYRKRYMEDKSSSSKM